MGGKEGERKHKGRERERWKRVKKVAKQNERQQQILLTKKKANERVRREGKEGGREGKRGSNEKGVN